MNHIILLFLALLWAVAADDEERRLETSEGDLCLKGDSTHPDLFFHVDADVKFWGKQKGIVRAKRCKKQGTKTLRDSLTTEKVFCGEIDDVDHELTAPAIFKNVVTKAGFTRGKCKVNGERERKELHVTKITIDEDPFGPDDDCYCEKNSGCLCPCDCNKPGAFEVDRDYVKRIIRRRNKPKRIRVRRRKRNQQKDPFE